MNVRTSAWQIKPGKRQKLHDWLHTLNTTRRQEAAATLTYENCSAEYAYVTTHDRVDYVMFLAFHHDTPKRMDMSITINQEHKAVLDDCVGDRVDDAKAIRIFDLRFCDNVHTMLNLYADEKTTIV